MRVPFTVVIATYNRPALLAEAIASVQAQTADHFECIVVDDGSRTAAAVLPHDDRRFRLLDLVDNGGVARARNRGVAEGTGDAVAFLDDDDLWTPTRLQLAADGLAEADIAVCGASWIGEATTRPDAPLAGNVHHHVLDRFTPNLGRTAVARRVLEPFDERYVASQDVEWWLRQSATATVCSTAAIGLRSRRHDGVRHGNGVRARVEAGERMLADHAGYFAAHRRARAFRLYRLAVFHQQLGQTAEARRWYLRSLRAEPSWRAARGMTTALRPPATPAEPPAEGA